MDRPIDNISNVCILVTNLIVGGHNNMMGISGFKTKKELKSAVGTRPNFIETSFFGPEYKGDGTYAVVGPDPYIRKWYAELTIVNGLIHKVS